MISQSSNRPVSALCTRMIEDMSVRSFSEKTRHDYIRNVRTLAPIDPQAASCTKRIFVHRRFCTSRISCRLRKGSALPGLFLLDGRQCEADRPQPMSGEVRITLRPADAACLRRG
jgi:hypothetical protein